MAHNATVNDDNIYDLSGEDGDGELATAVSVYHNKNQRPAVNSDLSGTSKKHLNPLAVLGMPTSAQMQDYYNPNGKLI